MIRPSSKQSQTGFLLWLTLLGVTRNAYARSPPESTSHGVVGLTPGLDAIRRSRFSRDLGVMPYTDHPDGVAFQPVEEAVPIHDHLTKAELRELRDRPPGIREADQMAECVVRAVTERPGRSWPLCTDVVDRGKELRSRRRREPDPTGHDRSSSASASAMTTSRSYPAPA